MKLIVTAFVLVFVSLALFAPLAATAHCDGDHESDCATECTCVCCCAPVLSCLEHASGLTAHLSEYASPTDVLFVGRLLIADIYRPPTSA
jgi:hypothetical protein